MNRTNGNRKKGFLRIWATTAGQSLPVQGVPIRIYDESGKLIHVLRTGEGGLTPTVELAAPPAAESLSPGGNSRPYTSYTVVAEMPGFQPVRDLTVPIFDGITSVQPLQLLPASGGGETGNTPPVLLYPENMYENLINGGGTPKDPLEGENSRYPLRPQNISERDEGYLDDIDLMDGEGNP